MPETTWMDKEGGLSEDSLYHSASLGKGQVHEVLVNNDDPGSVLTWDFDVVRADVSFTVYRTNVPLKDVTNLSHSNSTETEQPATQNQCQLQTQPQQAHHKSVIDKSWKESVDYFKVEPTLVCHDGESTQVRTSDFRNSNAFVL